MTTTELPDGVRREHIEPLWTRVDRNRWKLIGVVVAYVTSMTASAAFIAWLAVFGLGLFLLRAPAAMSAYYAFVDRIVLSVAVVSFAVSVTNVVTSLLRSERRLLGRFGALPTPVGQYQDTKYALKDMAIAVGYPHAPPLWVLPDCDKVNAFVVGRSERTAVVGVTQGLVERLSPDEQRAVFANLMARLRNGDVRTATAVSVLFGPIWKMREADYTRDEHPMFAPSGDSKPDLGARLRAGGAEGALSSLWAFVVYFFVIVLTEFLAAGHERGTRFTSGKADAEGMLLLRDPRTMLLTLEKVLTADNTVASAGEAYSALFYCWAGFGWAPEDDPEFERIARLREVLGVEGLVDPVTAGIRVAAARSLAPEAPRLEEDAR